jgi:cell division protein ZapA
MPEVEIEVGGRNYTIACQDGEEKHLKKAANLLDTEAGHVAGSAGRLPESRVLLMAGLMLADRMTSSGETEKSAEERISQLEERLRASETKVGNLSAELEAASQGSNALDDKVSNEALAKLASDLEAVADAMESSANA